MTALAPPRADPDLSYLLDRAAYLLRMRMTAALAELGITPRMHSVLVHALGGEHTQAQLAAIGDMDKTTMVVTVDALERAGLAVRRPSATDRRARIVAVTDDGVKVVARSQEVVDRVHEQALGSLPGQDRVLVRRALNSLVSGDLSDAPDADSAPGVRRARQREI